MSNRGGRAGIVTILVVLIALITPATSTMAAPANGQCTKRMLLHYVYSCTKGKLGIPEHCYHLVGTSALKEKELKRYLIVDVKTGESHRETDWEFQQNRIEKHATFGVPTRYVVAHPLWLSGAWYLFYGCQ